MPFPQFFTRYGIEKKELGSFDLLIANVSESDAGAYICQVNSNPMENLVGGRAASCTGESLPLICFPHCR